MNERFSRTELMLGSDAMQALHGARVAIFGVGGVGGYALEALVRSGIGRIHIIDPDTVSESNINRQIIATTETVGMKKTEAAKKRALSINPDVEIETSDVFYSAECSEQFDLSKYDYIIDAIDSVSSKILLIENAKRCGAPIISSMGAGNKLDPTAFEVSDISKTSVCPLARVMRTELRRRGINHLKVVYSKEEPLRAVAKDEMAPDGSKITRHAPGSIAFVPSVVGLIIASEVIKDLTVKAGE